MRILLRCVAGAMLVLLLTAALLLTLAVDGAPRVAHRDDVSPADVDRAIELLRQHDPRRAAPGLLQQLPLRQRDLDLLAHYAAQRWLATDARVQLQDGRLVVQTGIEAPLRRWLNITLGLRQTAGLPAVDSLRIGSLPLPAAAAQPALKAFAASRGVNTDALLAVELVERVTITAAELTVSYRMELDTFKRLRAALSRPTDPERLRAYVERLAELTRRVDGAEVSLAELLRPMLALAAQRSAAPGSDPRAENRAALLTLTFLAIQRPLGLLVPAAYEWTPPRRLTVTLKQRHDSAQHFMVSAFIAAESDSPLADAVGLWKEMADSRSGGSGFSFNDLAADRAGTRFGDLAARDPRALQARVAKGGTEDHFMPHAADLPEALAEAEFQQRFGGIEGAAFKRMRAGIEARVDALPMFR